MRYLSSSIVLVAFLLAAARSCADALIRVDGAVFDGKVLSEDDKEVVFEMHRLGAKDVLHFRRELVQRLVLDAPTSRPTTQQLTKKWAVPPEPTAPRLTPRGRGPTFYIVPLHGEVGATVSATLLEKALADAVPRKPTVVVLDIDSPGGLVDESKRMIAIISRYQHDLRIIALVDQDLSAAAIFSMSVKEVYAKPTATIGAATAFIPTQLWLPPKIEEKMQSAWRAVARGSAQIGGHDPLLAEAMIDGNEDLHIEHANGRPVIKIGPGDEMVSRKGKILTLTAGEAQRCGLTAGVVADVTDLGKALGMPGWTECEGLGTLLAEYWPSRTHKFSAALKQIGTEFEENMENARARHPTNLMRVTGFGARAQMSIMLQWHDRCVGCAAYLQCAASNLREALELARLFPEHAALAGTLKETLSDVESMRKEIYDSRLTPGVQLPTWAPFKSKAASQPSPGPLQPPTVTQLPVTPNDSKQPPQPQPTTQPKSTAAESPAGTQITQQTPRPTETPQPPPKPSATQKVIPPPAGGQRRIRREQDAYVTNKIPDAAIKSEMLGGHGGGEFVKVSRNNQPVIGFKFEPGNWGRPVVRTLDPIFDRSTAGEGGRDEKGGETVLAREGYVVGSVFVDTDNTNAVAVRLTFVRFDNGRTISNDAYDSDWIGTPAKIHQERLGDNRKIVIGTFGRKGMNMDAFGLVLLPGS